MRSVTLTLTAAAVLTLFAALPADAAAAHYHVKYRMERDGYRLFNRHDVAHGLSSYLKGIGCSSHVEHFGREYEVHYRCPNWRERVFYNHADAHRFDQTLRGYGFRTYLRHD